MFCKVLISFFSFPVLYQFPQGRELNSSLDLGSSCIHKARLIIERKDIVLFFMMCRPFSSVADLVGSPSNVKFHKMSQKITGVSRIRRIKKKEKIEKTQRRKKKPGLITDQNIHLVNSRIISHERSKQSNKQTNTIFHLLLSIVFFSLHRHVTNNGVGALNEQIITMRFIMTA